MPNSKNYLGLLSGILAKKNDLIYVQVYETIGDCSIGHLRDCV
jgi:hypothetical protein